MRRYGFVVGCLVSVLAFTASLYAADMQVGTWKINLAKSKYTPATLAPKSTTVDRFKPCHDAVLQVGEISSGGGNVHAVSRSERCGTVRIHDLRAATAR